MTQMTHADADELVLSHRRLARHLANRYARGSEPREDLEQVAYLGLVKAARRFDAERGVAFSTFAMPTVLGELRRFCRDTRWAVHVPRSIQEDVQALRRLEDTHQIEHGRAPSVAEAAGELGWSDERVLEARIAAGGLSSESLNAPLRAADGDVGEAIDALGDVDQGFESAERRDELARALAHLGEQEQRALRLRGEVGCSTPKIAQCMGISPSQAARLVSRSLADLRVALESEPGEPPRGAAVVRLADAAPELFEDLDDRARERARRVAVRRTVVEPGAWEGPAAGAAIVVLTGALLRTLALEAQPRAELVGPGDLVLDAHSEGEMWPKPSWQAIERTELAVLDRRVLDALCAWPAVIAAVLDRAARRSQALALQLAITDQRRVDDRLLSLFGALGRRWGRRTPEGVAIPLSLTHDTIAMLVGAHRPTITSALRRLSQEGRLRRSAGPRRWVLAHDRAPLRLAA
jgi:RNA polymerase sigma-B factor